MSTAEPEPGTERRYARCGNCGETVENIGGDWHHRGSSGSIARPPGYVVCDPRFVADYEQEKRTHRT